jgi:murein DD-endopeptidase MepM/ murein hydrolase activator NlpD
MKSNLKCKPLVVRSEAPMTIKDPTGLNPRLSPNYSLLWKYSAIFLGGIGLLSTGLLWTQPQARATGNNLVIPDANPPVIPGSSSPLIVPKPVPQTTPAKLPPSKPVVETKPTTSQLKPKLDALKPPTAAATTQLSAPKISLPETPLQPASSLIIPQIQPQEITQPIATIESGKNSYIDTTQYNTQPLQPTAPPTVVLKERSTGCQTVAYNGQLSRGQCGSPAVAKLSAPAAPVKAANPRSQRNLLANSPRRPLRINRPVALQPRPVHQNQVVSLKPIEMQGVKIALAPVPRYGSRATVMGSQLARLNRKTDLLFPLSIPAKITSAFGWRIHPITQSSRMHEGTDIAAPLGTPVLAAYPGEVAAADWAGGYGLMVVLRHLQGSQESRYAHLSEVYVQPGEWLERGAVIGRVGSTGLSTGPHLHFEWRHLTEQGWVSVDAGLHLQYAVENLIQTLQIAENNLQNQG